MQQKKVAIPCEVLVALAVRRWRPGARAEVLVALRLWSCDYGAVALWPREQHTAGDRGRPREAIGGHGRPPGGHRGQFPRTDFGPASQI